MDGGLYTASIAATVIILIILAGVKPLERRFIMHDELGAASPRVKPFVMQQSDDSPECDEVMIALHRVSNLEYEDTRAFARASVSRTASGSFDRTRCRLGRTGLPVG